MAPKHLYLFGGDKDWNSNDWTASDDRVRGGKSQSYLDVNSSQSIATFKGDLDIKTLGGAGFASQRTTADSETWNLTKYDGIELSISKADSKRYTFIVKDDIPSKRGDGRDQSNISYEYDFTVASKDTAEEYSKTTIFIPWSSLKATYRGKRKDDAPKLNKKSIKRFSIMNRSFFGDQEGRFELELKSIAAVQNDLGYDELAASLSGGRDENYGDIEKGRAISEKTPLNAFSRGADDTPDMLIHDGRRVRTAIARIIVYSVVVVLLVHGVMVLRLGCNGGDASRVHL